MITIDHQYIAYYYIFILFQEPREMKACTIKSEPFCNSIKALECLLVVDVF